MLFVSGFDYHRVLRVLNVVLISPGTYYPNEDFSIESYEAGESQTQIVNYGTGGESTLQSMSG